MAINNVSNYFRSKLSHIWVEFDLPGPSILRALILSPERPGKSSSPLIGLVAQGKALGRRPILTHEVTSKTIKSNCQVVASQCTPSETPSPGPRNPGQKTFRTNLVPDNRQKFPNFAGKIEGVPE